MSALPTTATQHDTAYLRLAFNEAAENQEAWRRNPMKVWERLYERVIDSEGGVGILKHIADQQAEIERLQHQVDALNAQLAAPRPKSLEVFS